MTPLRQRMLEDMRLRNLSVRTQETYLCQVSKFARYFKKSPEELGGEEIRQYQLYLIEHDVSWSVYNQTLCALRFLYSKTLKKGLEIQDIEFPRRPQKLPVVLSREEVAGFLDSVTDYRCRVVLTTIYAAGLRLTEGTNLKVRDIDSKQMTVRVEQGKGMKDRYVMLSPRLLVLLREYWKVVRPQGIYLFPSKRDPAKPMDESAVQRAFRQTLDHLGWRKEVRVHTLRHCFATHLLELNVDAGTIQMMMGHRSLLTTQRYLRVTTRTISQVRSPLDVLPDPGKV